MDIERASDNELVEAARRESSPASDRYLDALYRRFYPRVARWCLRICGNREEAADLAQDVFLRAHSRLDTFRMESSFSTWMYTVTRSVAINRGVQKQRRPKILADPGDALDPVDPAPGPREKLDEKKIIEKLRHAMETELEPMEARVLYLHHVLGMTLPAVTDLLELTNRSGAKALVVSGMRKLKRHFGTDSVADSDVRGTR